VNDPLTHLLTTPLQGVYDDVVRERFLVALKEMMVAEEERLEAQNTLLQMKESGVSVS
jgi:hypothetical protein